MNIKEIEAERQRANNLFKQQRIAEALEGYETSLSKAISLLVPSARSEALEEQLSLLTYNISTIYYKKKNFPRALVFALESLRYTRCDRTLHRICVIYLKLGMFAEYKNTYDQLTNKVVNPEVNMLLRRLGLDEAAVGLYLGSMLTSNVVFELFKTVSDNSIIPADVVESILRQGESVFLNCENVVYVESQEEVIVFGDTHGQYFDLVGALNTAFDSRRIFIFNGDYVDRGSHSVENFLMILSLKILFPSRIYMNRGNHELSDLNRIYGLGDEISRKYPFNNDSIYQSFQRVFRSLPVSTVVNGKVFITHGGLPATPINLDELQSKYRMTDSYVDTPLRELVWSDPGEITGVEENRRGAGVVFGSDITQKFLNDNNLDLLIRSHEFVENGYRTNHDGKVVTVFSAPDYEGNRGPGSYLILNSPYDAQLVVVSGDTRYRVVRFGKSVNNEPPRFLK